MPWRVPEEAFWETTQRVEYLYLRRARDPEDDPDVPEEVDEVEWLYWEARLYLDGNDRLEASSFRWRSRDEAVEFLRWLAANLGDIRPPRESTPPKKPKGVIEWEQRFLPGAWQLPDSTADVEWLFDRDAGLLRLSFGYEVVVIAELGRSEVGDFLVWLRDEIARIQIDPELIGRSRRLMPPAPTTDPTGESPRAEAT